MQICALTPQLAEQYEAFVLSHPETLLYQSWRYQSLLTELLGCTQQGLLALADDGRIAAALPLMAMDGPLGRVLNSLPFYGSNGGLIGDDPFALAALRGAYKAITQTAGVAVSTVIENPLAAHSALDLEHDLVDQRIGQFTPLLQSSDVQEGLMQSFHYKTRNMIRKAEKVGVTVRVDSDAMPFLYATHQENMREIGGLAKPYGFFEKLPQHFEAGRDYRIYAASLSGEVVAAVLVFFYNRTVEYYTPVVRKEFRETQALSAAIFSAMCDAASEGFSWWNWGGTWLSQDGVYRFKSRWGTRDIPYHYFTRVFDAAVLSAPRQQLLAAYPYFFTVPFSALKDAAAP
jgi:Acetyltransferase (GNAT) domain